MNSVASTTAAVVLVVEDDPLLRDYVEDILGQSGFEVIGACCAEEALARLADEPDICAVVSDVAMPGSMDGLGLASSVRHDRPRTGIILVSGVVEPPGHYLPSGVRFIPKPVRAATLLRLVREVADPRARLPEPQANATP